MEKIKFCLIPFILLFLFVSCESEFVRFQKKSLEFGSDNRISEGEYKSLLEIIESSNDGKFDMFKNPNGDIDNDRVIGYLLKYFNAKKMPIDEDDIIISGISERGDDLKFNINFFLENSASMDGYVEGITEFETAIYNLLGDFRTSDFCDSLNLHYINSTIPYTKKNAIPDDIQDFIERLDPSTFRSRGGNRGSSDLGHILRQLVDMADEDNISVLVSDFVFSPGKGKNAEEYLENQSVEIKMRFTDKLKTFNLTTLVVQMESNFSGTYYDMNNLGRQINANRPYYIWFIGSEAQIQSILKANIIDNIRGGYLNRLAFQPVNKNKSLDYKILRSNRIGTFNIENGSMGRGPIIDARASRGERNKAMFGFSFAIDYSSGLQDENFYLDSSVYSLSDPRYKLDVIKVDNLAPASQIGFSHLLTLTTNELIEENLEIGFNGRIPTWVIDSNSQDDTGMGKNELEINKTFGLEKLIIGVNDAYYSNSPVFNSIIISINK